MENEDKKNHEGYHKRKHETPQKIQGKIEWRSLRVLFSFGLLSSSRSLNFGKDAEVEIVFPRRLLVPVIPLLTVPWIGKFSGDFAGIAALPSNFSLFECSPRTWITADSSRFLSMPVDVPVQQSQSRRIFIPIWPGCRQAVTIRRKPFVKSSSWKRRKTRTDSGDEANGDRKAVRCFEIRRDSSSFIFNRERAERRRMPHEWRHRAIPYPREARRNSRNSVWRGKGEAFLRGISPCTCVKYLHISLAFRSKSLFLSASLSRSNQTTLKIQVIRRPRKKKGSELILKQKFCNSEMTMRIPNWDMKEKGKVTWVPGKKKLFNTTCY